MTAFRIVNISDSAVTIQPRESLSQRELLSAILDLWEQGFGTVAYSMGGKTITAKDIQYDSKTRRRNLQLTPVTH